MHVYNIYLIYWILNSHSLLIVLILNGTFVFKSM